MAEQVQATLDAMVAPLTNLQEREIFSPEEIAATIARRRESEYRLQRKRQPRLSDYISYIAVEEQLEQLRRVRMKKKKKLQLMQKNKEKRLNEEENDENKGGDRHILGHLLLIWKRTLRKFPSPDLFHQYAASCQRFSAHFALSRCYQDALALYGTTHGDFWIAAAQHEMVDNNAVGAARILLQRGLRVLKSNANRFDVWRASFVQELHWIQKLEGRRAILAKDGTEKRKEGDEEDAELTAVGNKSAKKSSYKVAKIIYKNAMAANESEPIWSWKFLEACRGFPAASLEDWILKQSSSDNETNPDLWIARAQYHAENVSGPPAKRSKTEGTENNNDDDLVLATIRQACSTVPTPDMYGKALEFLGSYNDESETTQSLVRDLISDIAQNDQLQCSADLLLCYTDSLTDSKDAIRVLSQCVNNARAKCIDVSLWTELARHVFRNDGPVAAQAILEPNPYPLSDPNHIVIGVQQLGLQIELRDMASSFSLLQRLLLLSPANPMAACHRPIVDDWTHLPAVCVMFLSSSRSNDRSMARKAYTAMLAAKCWNAWVQEAPESVQGILDAALSLEEAEESLLAMSTQQKKILFEKAIDSFKGCIPDLARDYRQRRDDTLRFRHATAALRLGRHMDVPCVDCLTTPEEKVNQRLQELYQSFSICLVRNIQVNAKKAKMGWRDVGNLFQSLSEKDKESWCTETSSTNPDKSNAPVVPGTMLSPSSDDTTRAYCSFIIQNDSKAYGRATEHLIPFTSFSDIDWQYESALWFFFGRNPVGATPLDGRQEHTDSISHDGTWHFQLAGTKTWYVRPTEELLRDQPRLQTSDKLVVQCNTGDVLIINTRLWFHRTEIPSQQGPSVSYARDFMFQSNDDVESHVQSSTSMTNVDGMYATNNIDAGTVIFTEDDMPDGQLHRSSDANCSVCELANGMQAVISSRSIRSGEFFCIPESDDDGSDSNEESSHEDSYID